MGVAACGCGAGDEVIVTAYSRPLSKFAPKLGCAHESFY
jgi:hypothetical protein